MMVKHVLLHHAKHANADSTTVASTRKFARENGTKCTATQYQRTYSDNTLVAVQHPCTCARAAQHCTTFVLLSRQKVSAEIGHDRFLGRSLRGSRPSDYLRLAGGSHRHTVVVLQRVVVALRTRRGVDAARPEAGSHHRLSGHRCLPGANEAALFANSRAGAHCRVDCTACKRATQFESLACITRKRRSKQHAIGDLCTVHSHYPHRFTHRESSL